MELNTGGMSSALGGTIDEPVKQADNTPVSTNAGIANGLATDGPPVSKRAIFQKLVVQEAKNRAAKGLQGAYNLSAQNTTGNPNLDNNVCIGGATDILGSQGFKFNKTSGTTQTKDGNTNYEFNPNFANEYKNQGFDIATDSPQEGDLVQYLNPQGVPHHMNIVVGTQKDGKSMSVYNAYNQKTGVSPIYSQNFAGDGRTVVDQTGQKDKIVVYRPTEKSLQGIDENSAQVKAGLANYDTQNTSELLHSKFSGVRVDKDSLIFQLKNGKEVNSNVNPNDYRKMNSIDKAKLFTQLTK